jgi:hypothetical protein
MKLETICTRDMSFDTGEATEPGSIHINILQPDRGAKLPILVEGRTRHNLVEFIDSVIGVICVEMLDRVRIDIRKDVILYLKNADSVDNGYGTTYVKACYEGDGLRLEGVNDISY